MTTEELIKALRDKTSRDNRKFLDEVADCVEMLQNALFALNEERINFQEEIKQQASIITSLSCIKTTVINNAKAEAVKEFAERLVYTLCVDNEENTEVFDYEYTLETIDNLVKEFPEGSKR